MSAPRPTPEQGPFRADQVKPGDRYELTRGHPVYCAPSGKRHGAANATGALPLATDPAVTDVGIDVGYTPEPGTLRAPDLSVGDTLDEPGWAHGAPPLAVEYADRGTDERDLSTKVEELLAAGTRWVWVVRLTGERRLEVYARGEAMRTLRRGETLTAPGVLANPLPVEALWDPSVAMETSLRNLLQRRGYASIEAIRAQGVAQGVAQGRAEGVAQGVAQGRAEGVASLLVFQFEQRLGRSLSAAERDEITHRVELLGAERVGGVVIQLTPGDLAAWLADPAAR